MRCLLTLWLIAVLAHCSLAQEKKPHLSKGKQQDATTAHDVANNPPPSSPVNTQPASPPSNARTDNQADEEHYRTLSEKFTVALIGVGVLQFLAMLLQYRAMRDGLGISLQASNAAKQSADFLVKSERAWLTAKVENFPEPPKGSQLIWIEIPITNNGKTSAHITTILATSKLIPMPETASGRPGRLPDAPDYSDGNRLVVVGERDIIIAPADTLRHMHVFIFPKEWERVKDRELSLYVYGEVEYRDTVIGEPHKTCFCAIYWVSESGYNEPAGFMFSQVIPAAYFCAT